jgi:ubiquinone/menaquinone biosynthesis C-methylase UbiE
MATDVNAQAIALPMARSSPTAGHNSRNAVPPSWYLDELAHAGPEHLDAGYVAGYDRKAGVDAVVEVAELGLSASSTLVELGTGTGSVALAAAPICGRVVAVDISAAMLAELRRKATDLRLTNLEVVRAGLLSYEHQGSPADVVYARHCLHQLPDFWKSLALRRMAAILRPRGLLRVRDLLFSCEIDEVSEAVERWLDRSALDSAVGWTRAELETHLREEHSTFTWLFETMLRHAGFEILQADYHASRMYAGYTCLRAM